MYIHKSISTNQFPAQLINQESRFMLYFVPITANSELHCSLLHLEYLKMHTVPIYKLEIKEEQHCKKKNSA
uniref:Uncharacterized protein n=1 Tax=Anguilla anguilla TaxID=7936 RepID=A0A0E9XU44_ANGAN